MSALRGTGISARGVGRIYGTTSAFLGKPTTLSQYQRVAPTSSATLQHGAMAVINLNIQKQRRLEGHIRPLTFLPEFL